MSTIGYLQTHAYQSQAMIPLKGVVVSVSDGSGKLLAVRITDESGRIVPIAIPVPDLADSRNPDFVGQPFTSVFVRAYLPDYEQIEVDRVQIFADTTTMQNLEMIPLSEFPESQNKTERFDIPPQNL